MDWGGVFWNFGYRLRKKSWKFGLGGYSGTSDLDLGKKVGNLDGGVYWNFGFGLRKKSWKFGLGGVFWNFGFGLREKSWKLGLGEWGGILELRIWT